MTWLLVNAKYRDLLYPTVEATLPIFGTLNACEDPVNACQPKPDLPTQGLYALSRVPADWSR